MYHIAFLVAYCSFLYKLYPIVDNALKKNTPLFEASNKKNYIVKNVIKAFSLALLFIMSFLCLNGWDNSSIRTFAIIYVSNDIMGIFMCEHLPTSTRIHHTTSIMFLMGALTIDFQTSHVAQMLFYFTYASAIAFPVNLYLGLRLCYQDHPPWLVQLRDLSKYLYASVCLVSWTYQLCTLKWVYHELLYCIMISFVVFDDIVLMRWLFSK